MTSYRKFIIKFLNIKKKNRNNFWIRRKIIRFKFFFKKQKDLDFKFFKKKFLYSHIFFKKNKGFSVTISFNAYQHGIKIIKKKLLNKKYETSTEFLKKQNKLLRLIKNNIYNFSKTLLFLKIFSFLYLYTLFIDNMSVVSFYFLKKNQINSRKSIFRLILSFKSQKLFFNLQNFKKKNLTSLTPGFFVKFFDKKKSIKKKKNVRLLTAKYLRKFFLLLKIKKIIFFIKNNPINLIEFVTTLNTPLIHSFLDPKEKILINEKEKTPVKPVTKILYFIFLKSIDYGFNKKRKIGRIKRKIYRKLVLQNNIID